MNNCRHKRIFKVSDQSADQFSWSYDGETFDPEYPPEIGGLCGDGGFEIEICLDCHKIMDLSVADIESLIDDNQVDVEDEEE